IGIDGGIVGIAETEFSTTGHVAELVDGSGVGAGAAKRRQVGDDGVAGVHHRLIGLEYLQRGVGCGTFNDVIEGIAPGHAVARTDFGLAPSHLDRIRQEYVGTCQIDVHGLRLPYALCGATREAVLPLPLAGEGWGGGVSAIGAARVERAPPRAFGATSPASGRGASSRNSGELHRLGLEVLAQ